MLVQGLQGPVHVLGAFFKCLPLCCRPFEHFRHGRALQTLRTYLANIGVAAAREYRTHDLRRGHARDLQSRGAGLLEILSAGEWRSPAFLKYLDMQELEKHAVLQAHLDDSSESDSD